MEGGGLGLEGIRSKIGCGNEKKKKKGQRPKGGVDEQSHVV